jgi:hypothetical protein
MRSASGSNRECRTSLPVAWLIRVAFTTLCLAVHGCDTVTGGAVELSWKLRPASGSLENKFVDCDFRVAYPVTKIRLHWAVDNGTGDSPGNEGSEAWSCQFNHGVTGFELAAGTANLWVTPECDNGPARPEAYIAPAIVQRSVSRGDTVSLGAVELVVAVTDCKPPPPEVPEGETKLCICDP